MDPGPLSLFVDGEDPLACRPDESASDHGLFVDWMVLPASIRNDDARAARNLQADLRHLRHLRRTRHWDARLEASVALDVDEWRRGHLGRLEAGFGRLLNTSDRIDDVIRAWCEWAIHHPERISAVEIAKMMEVWRETLLALRPVEDDGPRNASVKNMGKALTEDGLAKTLAEAPADSLLRALAVLDGGDGT